MKKLLLLRHAKSSRNDASLADHDRPLSPRGERAAERMALHLAGRRHLHPDLVLCSSALRTRETLQRLLTQLPGDRPVLVEPELYLASPGQLLERVAAVGDEISSLLVIGHNPGLEDLARGLAGDGESAALRQLERGLPTAALAEIELAIAHWGELEPGVGRLASFTRPKELA